MKILCVIDCLGSGGAQRQLVELALGFKQKGFQVSFLVYYDDPFYNKILEVNGICITLVEEPNYFKRFLKMRKLIRGHKANIVIAFLESSSFICELSSFPRKNWKLIVGERSANPRIKTNFRLRLYRYFHLLADYVVSNSKTNLKMVRDINPFLSEHKCKVIYNGLDLTKWNNNKKDNDHNENNVYKILIAASHQKVKNLKSLILAVCKLSIDERKRLKIIWYGKDSGDGSLEEGKSLIENFNLQYNFDFQDAHSEIQDFMCFADCIGLFSLYEGFPNALCEGMALGKPIITSNVSDIPILVNNENGFLCDPNNIYSIQGALLEFLNTSRYTLHQMGERSRRVALSHFDHNMVLSSYIALFENKY